MLLSELTIAIEHISGVGKKTAHILTKLNIFNVSQLVSHYPRDWEDKTKIIPLNEFSATKKVFTPVQILSHEYIGYGTMKTLKVAITDGKTQAFLLCFNRPFLSKILTINAIVSLSGIFYYKYNELQSSRFEIDFLSANGNLSDFFNKPLPNSGLIPIYPLTAGMSQIQLKKIIQKALHVYVKGIETELPPYLIEKYDLLQKNEAIHCIHEPKSIEQALKAKKTLIFEELYFYQKAIIQGRLLRTRDLNLPEPVKNLTKNEFFNRLSPLQKQLFNRLAFDLTTDQMDSILIMNNEIDYSQSEQSDKNFYLSRLLQGDVGSGKTLVAFFVALRIIDWNGQVAFLAPTEILAQQHAQKAAELLNPILTQDGIGIRIAFLTGNVKNKQRNLLLKELKTGGIDIIIGTHALFSQNVVYYNLSLAIIDEQHRFGVVQRNMIISKGQTNQKTPQKPALLMMSATPIPQSLALSMYSDLDISLIKTMPIGRMPIITRLNKTDNAHLVYNEVKKELLKGKQAYFVYPLIGETSSENENLQHLKSAEKMYEFLSKTIYPEFSVALIHSKINESEQINILDKFNKGIISVLVATSVVEVGVDVPNATCMVIEHAERFGLAALHQLRGRVGRNNEQGYCFLIYGNSLTKIGKERLKTIREHTDGFFIAEEDMKLRGPGDIIGTQQSGYLSLGIADPVRDIKILKAVRAELLRGSV